MSAPALTAVKTVLVADDTAFVRERFKTALETAGHRAIVVATAQDLLSEVRQTPAQLDLIVVDLRLPNGHGIEIIKGLRKVDGLKAPLIVFSGTIASADEVRQLSALGVAGYINEYTSVQHILPSLAPHLFPDHYNRRSSPRVALGVSISCRVKNSISPMVTLNVSRGGLAVRTASPLDVGTDVRIRFRLPGGKKEIDAEARVAWIDSRTGMGLRFTKIDPADQASIEAWVHAHFFSNRRA
jgi:uncharacterized protein (TIGR02266 family)